MRIDITGQRFGKVVVLRYSRTEEKRTQWICQCDCGQVKEITGRSLRLGVTKSCGCLRREPARTWNGYGEISGAYWTSLVHGAKRRNIPFPLTKKEGWELFLQQDKKCAMTRLPLIFVRKYTIRTTKIKQTASLDRIDNTKGYELGNVQWVHKRVNQMKWDVPLDEFLNWCKLISENANEYISSRSMQSGQN